VKEWFANLEARERTIVATGGVVVVLILFWALIWLPLERGRQNLSVNVETWQQSLAELRVLAATLPEDGAPAAAPVDPDESPVVVVDRTLRERNLNSAVKRRQPTPNGIRVEFENVAFDQLVVWLGDLSATHGLSVQAGSLSLANRAGPGRVNASLTLERAP
jgi:general secretion pathway protein M